MGQTIACANQKGGVGKTTTVVNLGSYLALAGERVLVVDLDPQGNATSGLGFDRGSIERSVYDSVVDGRQISESIAVGPVPGLDVVPSAIALAGAELELAPVINRIDESSATRAVVKRRKMDDPVDPVIEVRNPEKVEDSDEIATTASPHSGVSGSDATSQSTMTFQGSSEG